MESMMLFNDFDEKTFKSIQVAPYFREERFQHTNSWSEHGVELAKVLSPNMLVKEIATTTTDLEDGFTEKRVKNVSVHLCYNWRFKTEFMLMKTDVANTFSYYTAQYGKNDNYEKFTRHEYEFAAYSVEAFKREQSELARCLETV